MQLERNIFRNSIMSTYPSYMKKTILKQVVDDGLVINNKREWIGIDVSDDNTLDEKISHILDNDAVLSFMEEYEYKKAYRHFCYFKISGISLEKIEKLVEQNKINVFDKKELISIDEFDKPSIYIVGGEIIFIIPSDSILIGISGISCLLDINSTFHPSFPESNACFP